MNNQEEFLSCLREAAIFWSRQNCESNLDRCNGLCFSILNIIDGTCGSSSLGPLHIFPRDENGKIDTKNPITDDNMMNELFYMELTRDRFENYLDGLRKSYSNLVIRDDK